MRQFLIPNFKLLIEFSSPATGRFSFGEKFSPFGEALLIHFFAEESAAPVASAGDFFLRSTNFKFDVDICRTLHGARLNRRFNVNRVVRRPASKFGISRSDDGT